MKTKNKVVKVQLKKVGQSKKMSITESILNVLIGFGIAILAQYLVFPLFGINVGLAQHLGIAVVFTGVSLIRSYVLRRFFNWLDIKDPFNAPRKKTNKRRN
jgi:hypothetical protein